MGTWAAGNFDNDTALDYLSDMVARWEAIVDQVFEGRKMPEEAEPFRFQPGLEAVDGCVMPTVEIILAAMVHLGAEHYPPVGKVDGWKARALAIYDAEIDGYEPDDEYKAERRGVIASTFDRLLAISTERRDRFEGAPDEEGS